MKASARARFYVQMARLLGSGIAPEQALAMLGEEASGLTRSLREGSSLARAWRSDPGFGEMELRVVEAGEVSGSLTACFESLATHFERRDRIERKMIAKLLYPVILLHAVFLLPALGLFLTEGVAAYFRVAVLPLILGWTLVVTGVLLVGRIRSSPDLAAGFDRALLRLPLLGSIMRDRSLGLYSAGLALLLSAGLPLIDSLDRAATMVPNRRVRSWAEVIAIEVRRGAGLAESMAVSFPVTFVEMVRVGEATGRLDEQLEAASHYFDQESQVAVTRLVTVLFFLAFLLVAIVVGAVVVRSWLAILGF